MADNIMLKLVAFLETAAGSTQVANLQRQLTEIEKQLKPIKINIDFEDLAGAEKLGGVLTKVAEMNNSMLLLSENIKKIDFSKINSGASENLNSVDAATVNLTNKLIDLRKRIKQLSFDGEVDGVSKSSLISGLDSLLKGGITTQTYEKATTALLDLSDAYHILKNAQTSQAEAENRSKLVSEKAAASLTSRARQLQNLIHTFKDNNPLYYGKKGSVVDSLMSEFNSLISNSNFDFSTLTKKEADELSISLTRIRDQLGYLKNDARELGLSGDTLVGKFKSLFEKVGGWTIIGRAIAGVRQQLAQMLANVKEIDLAMVELKKVTDETNSTYERFLTNATKRAKELGATLVDAIQATADYARLGFGIAEAESLADASIVYKNVGDGLKDITEASESIISTMKAFNVEASDAMSIVDRYNEIGEVILLPIGVVICQSKSGYIG